ncbi:15-hydroxyprostaglandin dehydrogenase [NAD(+)]-like isoform X1 [Pungitius pungitius]|uniref:15-hydroxyprostaglandin dehydrogenase [NAD(+)]-like isoform X1 n=1 Tax=Pungitius pungitius TaxID=134920 RepID=UPI002E101E63
MALQNRVAVVTGAAQGVGRAMAEILLQNGAKVALLDVNEAAGKSLKEVLDKQYGTERSLFLSCDVESEEQIKAAFQRTAEALGGVDIVCNNAGILNEAEWKKTISINLVAVVQVTYTALEHMNKLTGGRGGVIINTASMAGTTHNAPSGLKKKAKTFVCIAVQCCYSLKIFINVPCAQVSSLF